MLLQSHETELDKVTEQPVVPASRSSKHIHELRCQLEWRLLELETLARRVRKEEPVVNVHDVSFRVDHNVLVVPVFYLQNVLH